MLFRLDFLDFFLGKIRYITEKANLCNQKKTTHFVYQKNIFKFEYKKSKNLKNDNLYFIKIKNEIYL